MPDVVPTVDDLRTKLCYICREVEDVDAAAASAAWVHPCGACVLVAHEECLLQWMRGAQQSDVHAAKALVCPQCGSAYDIEGAGRRTLALLRAGDRLLAAAGAAPPVVIGLLVGIAVLGSMAASLGAYGAWALRTLGGAEAFDAVLPARWPRAAYVYFPLVGGVLSYTSTAGHAGALFVLALAPAVLADARPSRAMLRPTWPPSPFALALALPLVHRTYAALWTRTAMCVVGHVDAARLAAPPPEDDIGARIQNAGTVAGVAQALNDPALARTALGELAAPLCAAGVGAVLSRLGHRSALVRTVLGVGAETHGWAPGEPVWWRNALGLGVCVVARDGLTLWHAWLEKRKWETARVRSRSATPYPRSSLEAKRGSTTCKTSPDSLVD